jgi:hypothetical protein
MVTSPGYAGLGAVYERPHSFGRPDRRSSGHIDRDIRDHSLHRFHDLGRLQVTSYSDDSREGCGDTDPGAVAPGRPDAAPGGYGGNPEAPRVREDSPLNPEGARWIGSRFLRMFAGLLADKDWLYEMRKHEVVSARNANRIESAYLHDRLASTGEKHE